MLVQYIATLPIVTSVAIVVLIFYLMSKILYKLKQEVAKLTLQGI